MSAIDHGFFIASFNDGCDGAFTAAASSPPDGTADYLVGMSAVDLTKREHTLVTAFVTAWEASSPGPAQVPFVLDSVQPFAHPNWPTDVPAPRREDSTAAKPSSNVTFAVLPPDCG